MNKKFTPILLLIVAVLVLSGCAFRAGGQQLNTANNQSATTATATPKASPTPRPKPTQKPTVTAQPTTAPFADVEAAASAYAEALKKGDADAAGSMLSRFGLMVASLTNGEATTQLKDSAVLGTLDKFKIVESKQANPTTVLVHVTYTAGKDAAAHDELWPFRQENGKWRYNWANLIDFHTLTVEPQSTNGVTMQPLELQRYSDHIHLILMGQNHTNEPVVFGQVNEILAKFYFEGKVVEAEKTHLPLDALRSNLNLGLDIKGYFETYPNKVDIRTWRDYQVKPWFSFDMP
jgi:hypothetical protein